MLLECLEEVDYAKNEGFMPYTASLNCESFFKFWAVHAFNKINKRLPPIDRIIAQIAAILFGAFTLGIGPWVCKKKCLSDRKVTRRRSQNIVQAPRENRKVVCGLKEPEIRRLCHDEEGLLLFLNKFYEEGGFNKFREKYREFTIFMEQNRIERPLRKFIPVSSISSTAKQMNDLALACDLLDTLDKKPKDWRRFVSHFENEFDIKSPSFDNILKIVAEHCHVKDMSNLFFTLYPNDHEISGEIAIMLMIHWINHSDLVKLKMALPFLWTRTKHIASFDQVDGSSGFLRLIPSLCTHEKFQTTFESLLAFKFHPALNEPIFINTGLPEALVCCEGPHLMPISKRMEIIKNVLWKNCLKSIEDLESNANFMNIAKPIVACQRAFYQKVCVSLKDLIEKSKGVSQETSTDSNFSFKLALMPDETILEIFKKVADIDSLMALCHTSKENYQKFTPLMKEFVRENLLKFVSMIKDFNNICKFPSESLAEIIGLIENLSTAACGALTLREWLQIKNLFEMLVFERVVDLSPAVWDDWDEGC